MEEKQTDNTAKYTSKGFLLDPTQNYIAYYPIVNSATASSSEMVFSWGGQEQVGNNSTEHLGKYDYLVSDAIKPSDVNTVEFSMNHVGAITRFIMTVPAAIKPQKFILKAVNNTFDNTITKDIFNNTTTSKNTSDEITINLKGIELDCGDELIVWAMLPPYTKTSNSYFIISVIDEDGDEFYALDNDENFLAGTAYSFNFGMLQTNMLKATFDVSNLVRFTAGNLVYKIDTYLYQIAPSQEYVINSSSFVSYYEASNNLITTVLNDNTKYIDVFSWGTGNNPAYTSKQGDLFAEWTDWGTVLEENTFTPAGCRTPTSEEWKALFNKQWIALTRLYEGTSRTKNVGIVVFPYNMTAEDCNSYLEEGSVVKYDGISDSWTLTECKMSLSNLYKSKALYLPGCGHAIPLEGADENIFMPDSDHYYWTSTSYDNTSGICFMFTDEGLLQFDVVTPKYWKCGVRLIREI